MIVTKQKPMSEILDKIRGYDKIFLAGCGVCATACGTGGEDALKKMRKLLGEKGKKVCGSSIIEPACNLMKVKKFYRDNLKEVGSADAVLSFACGGGTQAIAEIVPEKTVLPGNDTLFQGDVTRSTLKEKAFDKKCSLCGECLLAETAVICPVTRCSKGILNGPCGGAKNGKCEIDEGKDCAWILIYKKLKDSGSVAYLKKIKGPKDHGLAVKHGIKEYVC